MDSVDNIEDRRVALFLKELGKLTRKHKLELNSCGCCESIFITELKEEETGPDWRYSDGLWDGMASHEGVEWTNRKDRKAR